MWPELFGLKTYTLVYVGSIAVHWLAAVRILRNEPRGGRLSLLLAFVYAVAMFPGARILSELLHGTFVAHEAITFDYWFDFMRWTLWGGPLVYLAIMTPATLLFSKHKSEMMDFMVLPLPFSMIAAKIACFCNGCCHGAETLGPWGLRYAEGADCPIDVPLHPTQLYEIVVLLIALAVFSSLNRARWRGQLALCFVAIYGTGRALTEFFRPEDELERMLGPMSSSQWVCLGAATCSATLLLAMRSRIR